ncbi:MAG: hypothetical protein ACXQTO_00615, partial [Candidatus Syntropharchaeales archaeon]
TGEFRDFEIIREEDLTEAVYERMDTAARYMREMTRNLGEKIDKVGEKVDAGREENKQGFSMLGEKIDSIKDDTSAIRTSLSSLDDLKNKYEELRRDILEIKQALKEKGIV